MARSRRAKPEMTASTQSWDAVSEDDDLEYTEEDEREEMGGSYVASRPRSRTSTPDVDSNDRATPKPSKRQQANGGDKRMAKSYVEPELVMPKNFDGSPAKPKMRASTPHFRMNERSMTSDAGAIRRLRRGADENKPRAATPHLRMNDRSSTSDAGRFNRPRRGPETKEERLRREAEFDEELDATSDLNWPFMVWSAVRPVLRYFASVLYITATHLKPAFGLIFVFWLVFGIGRNFLIYNVNQALSPLCRIPGVSWFEPPFCPLTPAADISGPAEFDKLVEAQSAFNDVLASTAGGYSLPLEMKRSEAGIRDLKHVVEYSTLPSRNELVFEFGGFIDTARQASQDLSKFNSRIGGAVDHILSTNRWTLQVIEGVRADEEASGGLSRWVSRNLDPFAPFRPVALSRDALMDQYLRHTEAVEEEIMRLIDEAHALLNVLDNLDGRLDLIASIATRDGIRAQDNREELFATLWTKLGGNRASVAKVERQLKLLKDVGSYRRLAWAHVTGAIVKLQAIRNNLEDLRGRVAMPEVVGAKVPLEVHINNINLGIERLEAQRDTSRRIEAENYQRVLARAGGIERMIGGREL